MTDDKREPVGVGRAVPDDPAIGRYRTNRFGVLQERDEAGYKLVPAKVAADRLNAALDELGRLWEFTDACDLEQFEEMQALKTRLDRAEGLLRRWCNCGPGEEHECYENTKQFLSNKPAATSGTEKS